MDAKDRRQCPRFEESFRVDLLNMGDDPRILSWEAVVPAEALDVSKHGLRLQSVYNVAVGSLLSIIAYYHEQESICLCEVVWKREADGQHMYGLYVKEWTRLDAILKRKLDAMESESPGPSGRGDMNVAGNPVAA